MDTKLPIVDRPPLLLAAVDMGRHAGTESGRAWAWACALARHFRLHIVTSPEAAERCRGEDLAAEWQWHPTTAPQPMAMGMGYYRAYARWCADVPAVVRQVAAAVRPVGLHHVTLGSFRVLPRYDRCAVPYTLGPLGGGEVTPRGWLRTARLPLGPWCSEIVRPWLNRSACLVPALRSVLRNSRLALATSAETEALLQRMGARHTAVVFPDRLPADVDAGVADSADSRGAGLPAKVKLVWSGRAVWWKAGHLAIELLRRALAAGCNAELVFYSHGHALPHWQRAAQTAGVSGRCHFNGFVARTELLRALGRAHAFVYPTFHDSSSPALLEAYAMGLPSLTVGLGGPAVVATPDTGYNQDVGSCDTWLEGAVQRLRHWQADPAAWIAASQAARARAQVFGDGYLEALVDRWLLTQAIAL